MMRAAVLWGLLVLLCQHSLVSGHVLGRPSSSSDLAQLKSLLQRFEETLAEAAQEEGNSEADYEETNQEPEQRQAGQGWSPEQEVDQEALIPERSEGRSRTAASTRSRLQDLLLTARKKSSCFGARMDRIGNASGLGCNNGRG
ncbi:natriuretic peptides A [Notolabrus celidotus]|uniref:natriuretic peptides A n=1 Tax=Notolabrus celidotus TaxID=1203425 RepID=UPI00149050E9|nr:natriuretic peptides A [Notolabrus celidotus]XP_034551191.1 natriuretic peptides A [Notolabrus celidotus]